MKIFKKYEKIDIISNIIVFSLAILNLFPLYWLITGSFKSSAAIYKMPPDWFPKTFFIENYIELFKSSPALRWGFNSVFVAFATTSLVVLISSAAAYAFAKLKFKGRDFIFYIFIGSLMVPKETFIIPLFKIIVAFDWMNTYQALIIPNVATAFGVFMLKGFFESIPDSIRESARLDGANEFIVFFKIHLPLVKPGIGALFILNFVQIWNDYLWQLLMTNSKEMKTLTVGVASLMQEISPNYALKMTGASVAAIPMILMFIIFQKYFTSGITQGAVKE